MTSFPKAAAGLVGMGHLGNDALKSGNVDTPGQLASLGVPKTLNILNN